MNSKYINIFACWHVCVLGNGVHGDHRTTFRSGSFFPLYWLQGLDPAAGTLTSCDISLALHISFQSLLFWSSPVASENTFKQMQLLACLFDLIFYFLLSWKRVNKPAFSLLTNRKANSKMWFLWAQPQDPGSILTHQTKVSAKRTRLGTEFLSS